MAAAVSTISSTVFNLYLAVVCAFSLLAVVIIGGSCVNAAIEFVYPAPLDVTETVFDAESKTEIARTPEAIEKERQQRHNTQRYYQVKGMLSSFIYFFLAAVVFAVHWRLFRRRVVLSEVK